MEHVTQFPEEYSKMANVQKKVGTPGPLPSPCLLIVCCTMICRASEHQARVAAVKLSRSTSCQQHALTRACHSGWASSNCHQSSPLQRG